ncbi:calnexin-like isoform X1 [Cotesia glomerata]|uniref:calnexin-like isoform X1 n=1 Tax=Cotesia glomerata TaxID=32391 RepID=UPI001D00B62A|nr:calnexin-like isoform X1 [Cotesia glomerata]
MARTRALILVLIINLFSTKIFCEESHSHDQDFSDEDTKASYTSPVVSGFAYLAESFDDSERFKTVWIQSQAKKESADEDIAKYDGVWSLEESLRNQQDGDLGLVLKSKARHAAISALLNKPFKFDDKPLIVQYEVNFQEGQECGGAYLKLLTQDPAHADLKKFHDKTPYTIMFGPDKCGNDHKLHFIFRHKNPVNGTIEEKHCKKPKERLEDYFKDKIPHLYTLVIRPDNSFIIKVDNKIVNEGSLLDDFTPPVNPPLEIEDPNDTRPEDWDDREKIPDPTAVKPEDWDEDAPVQIVDEDDVVPEGWLEDEPPTIPNPDAVKPEDWDVEMDGEWEPPEIPNPKCEGIAGCGPYKQKMKKNPRYKGKWLAPLIDNPNYKGKWKPRLIHNPDYFNDDHPFRMSPIHAIGFELWSMSPDIYFDNLIITDDEDVAKQWAEDTFEIHRKKIAQDSVTIWGRLMRSMNHKPGWWAAYFIYCSIPITIYIWYLYKRAKEDKDDRLDDKESLNAIEEDLNEQVDAAEEDVQQESATLADADDHQDNASETEEADNEKEEHTGDGDGPRRRKANKE